MEQNPPTNSNKIMDKLFIFCVKNRIKIIFVFKIWFIILLAVLLFGSYAIYSRNSFNSIFIYIGSNAGKLSIIFYFLTITPGIAKRFGVKNKFISIIMIFRRYFGISMFLTLLIHYFLVRGVNTFFKGIVVLPPPFFELFGILGLVLLIPLFLTSNDLSLKSLGKWWYLIHKLTYIIIWLIFLHVALQRVSVWSILAGTAVLLQLISFIYAKFHTSKSPVIVS